MGTGLRTARGVVTGCHHRHRQNNPCTLPCCHFIPPSPTPPSNIWLICPQHTSKNIQTTNHISTTALLLLLIKMFLLVIKKQNSLETARNKSSTILHRSTPRGFPRLLSLFTFRFNLLRHERHFYLHTFWKRSQGC